jgi:hypothetical protein
MAAQLSATDPEGTTLTFARTSDALHGQVTISATGAAIYIPVTNYSGQDTFGIRVTDAGGAATNGTVTVTVAAVNDAPTAVPAALTTGEDVVLDLNLTTIVSDVDANPLSFTTSTAPAHGTLTITAGEARYRPALNYFGADSYAVLASDGAGGEVTATVSITITSIDDNPVLTSTQVSVAEDGVVSTQLTAADVEGQTVSFQVGTGATHGSVSITPTGLLTYTPAANYNGPDTLTVGVTDNGLGWSFWPLDITVSPVNDAPVAFEDLLRLPSSASVTVPVLTNDSDIDGDSLSVTILDQPGGGTLSVSGGNVVTFTRENAFNGPIRFRYRIADASGATAEAEVRAVIGEFPGIYYLSDETTVGQLEVHWFDGLRVYRIGTDLDPGDEISSFSMASDGQTVAYVVESATVSRVFLSGPSASDSRVIFTSAPKPAGSSSRPYVRLNRNGSYLWVYDPFIGFSGTSYIVRTADGLQTRVAANTPQVTQIGNYFEFNPVNDDFYVQAEAGGAPPPPSGTGYLTLFRGNAASAGTLNQVGATYPAPSNGGGGGIQIAVTADGRYALHQEYLFSPNRSSVLVYDSVTGSEAPAYRRPLANQIGMWNGFSLSNDGARVCFLFREPDGGGSFGPSTFVAGSPGAPAAVAPITPVVAGGYTCHFGSDNHTMFYLANTVAEPRQQMYSVDAASPGTPVTVNRPLVAGETLENWWVARDTQRIAFSSYGVGPQRNFYSVSLDAPANFITFATNVFDDGSLPGQLEGGGYILAYSRRPAPFTGLRRLTLLSTQSASYSFSLTRADTSTGLQDFQWAP